MNPTSVFEKNLDAYLDPNIRIIVNEGGTWSSKTFSILQLLDTIARKVDNILISCVSESMPHLKRGALRDYEDIQTDENVYNIKLHNRTDQIFKVGKSRIEFFSADNDDKVKGARRDILFMNEAYAITKKIFDQLEVRTRQKIFIDYNPTSEFWVHKYILPRKDAVLIHSTYHDNEHVPGDIKATIEARKETDPAWYRVYALGLVGQLKGLIFEKFNQVNEMPDQYRWKIQGLDFGYTNDVTSLVDVCLYENELYIDELIYKTALKNDEIARKMMTYSLTYKDDIFADSAEPKSIDEINEYGFNVKAAPKGPDSIRNGINRIKQYKINITKRSLNTIKEFRNYRWKENKDGELLNVPIDDFNHSIDAIRYALAGKFAQVTTGTIATGHARKNRL